MKVEYVICAFTLCTDVLEDVLQFGTRRRLSQLQRIGRQFHCVIANRFVERPLLVLHRIQTDYPVGFLIWVGSETFFSFFTHKIQRKVIEDKTKLRLSLLLSPAKKPVARGALVSTQL